MTTTTATAGSPALTNGRDDLRFQTELRLKPVDEIADTATSVTCDIRYFANVVEHVSTREQQDRDQTDGCPYVAVLNNR